MSRKLLSVLVVLTSSLPFSALAAQEPDITVGPSATWQDLQDAVDSASDGDVIELVGEFFRDGGPVLVQKSIKLIGRAVDNDGDGKINEDWLDGIDNDSDGLTDEDDWDTILWGGSGGWAFQFHGISGTVKDVLIEGIGFYEFARAISFIPEAVTTAPDGAPLCPFVSTLGAITDIRVEGNFFGYNGRAVQFFGAVEEATVTKNVFKDTFQGGVFSGGETLQCLLPGGDLFSQDAGVPKHVLIEDNEFHNPWAFPQFSVGFVATDEPTVRGNSISGGELGVAAFRSESGQFSGNSLSNVEIGVDLTDSVGSSVRGNSIQAWFRGVGVFGSSQGISVRDNSVTGTFHGLLGLGDGGGTHFFNNQITNTAWGVQIEVDSTGFTVHNNTFGEVLYCDVFLFPSTADNTVISSRVEISVADVPGSTNSLIGMIAPCPY